MRRISRKLYSTRYTMRLAKRFRKDTRSKLTRANTKKRVKTITDNLAVIKALSK